MKRLKAQGVPAKANAKAQKIFLETELQPRLEEAKSGARTVYFADSAHLTQGAHLGHLWSFTRHIVQTPSGRQRHNVLGALNATTHEILTVSNDTYITSTQVCELLEQVTQTDTTKPITMVLDNARYQRCKLVLDRAEALGVELLFLPPYSPNLNLIERLWKFLKKEVLNSRYYATFAAFKGAIAASFNRIASGLYRHCLREQ